MKRDWVSIIAIGIIIACAVVAVQVYYNERITSCMSNPLVYGANKLSKDTGYDFYGTGSFKVGGNTASPIIYFDSKSIRAQYPNQNYNGIGFNFTGLQ